MSDLLGIGSSALSAYRSALNAIGENVANAQTPGYARRAVTLKQAGASGARTPIYREQILFNGVTAAGVTRAWDAFRAAEARHATSAAGRAEVREQWLTGVEAALDDGPGGVGASLTAFFNAGTALAADPADPIGRSVMLMALEDVATAFRRTSQALARVSEGLVETAKIDAEAVSNALGALHDVNGTLRASAAGGSARASLEDERDRLIDFIAERVDVDVSINGDGTAGLTLGSASAVELLTGPGPGFVTMVPAADGRISFQLSVNGTIVPLPAAAGRLAGLGDVASSTADRRAALDDLAGDLVAAVNVWSAGGVDANGDAGVDLLEATTGAGSLRVLVDDPALVPAALPAGAANGNLLALEGVRAASDVEEKWSFLVSGNAQALASAGSEAAAASSWRDHSFAALDEVTGVDLDYEAAELLRYQQSYNGAARIVQVARETINAIFDLF